MEDPAQVQKLRKKKKRIRASPEDDPLWGLFGVWGRVLIVFSNIGFILFLGSLLLGWGMFKFLIHVFGAGLLLLFARPNYSPFLSSTYCDSGMTREEIEELRRMIIRKLTGITSASGPARAQLAEQIRRIAPQTATNPEPERAGGLVGSLGAFGRFLKRVVENR